MIRGIHHTAIVMRDPEAMLTFYRDVLGGEVVFESRWRPPSPTVTAIIGETGTAATLTMLRFGNVYLELFEYTLPAVAAPTRTSRVWQHGFRHLCFDVADLVAEFERLSSLGVRFDGEVRDAALARSVYGRDPDGNILEFQETIGNGPFLLPQVSAGPPIEP